MNKIIRFLNKEQKALLKRMIQVNGTKPFAIVLGGSVNGLSFLRSLGRRGVPCIIIDSDYLIGMYSRLGRSLLLPDPQENPAVWLEVLEFIGHHLKQPAALFATSDVHSLFIAENAKILRCFYHFITPDYQTLEKILNKRSQYEIAAQIGIPIPRTYFPENGQAILAISQEIDFPCILKPYKSHIARNRIPTKVLVIESPKDLNDQFVWVASKEIGFMVQEIIPGGDNALFGYLALWDESGVELAWLTKQKLRQYPLQYGDGSLQITVQNHEVAELSRRLLRAFNYVGFVGIEFKYDIRDQTYRLMEINPRTVSGNQLAISAGIDFPWIAYNYLLKTQSREVSVGSFKVGIKFINEEWDFKAYLVLRKSGALTLRDWIRSIKDVRARAITAWDDPLPTLVVLSRFFKAFLHRIFAKFLNLRSLRLVNSSYLLITVFM